MNSKTYLGDGLYAHDEGFQVVLSTERENGVHYVALEPEVLESFMRFIERAHGLIITVAHRPKEVANE